MKTEAGTRAVRHQFGLGRLLPLGGPADGAWITEQAAIQALRRAANEIPDVRLESVRIGPAPLASVSEPAVRPPASALPPSPLRIKVAFSASLGEPLPETADQLRSRLLDAAARRLGLATVAADLRVTDLHEVPQTGPETRTAAGSMTRTPQSTAAARTTAARSSLPVTGAGPPRGPVGDLADVAAGVPGVAGLTTVLGSRPVRMEDHADPPGRRVEVHLAVAPGHHPLEVARAVRAAVAEAATTDAPGPVTVAVLITETAA
ncbi:hypothetical protein P9869_04185 [Streptomyces ossamyceticus]|nr:hypothetical protein [Streptomyces ossamyceticus]